VFRLFEKALKKNKNEVIALKAKPVLQAAIVVAL
jgi:hypothetical protein